MPKASDKVLLGKEFRRLWTCEEGFYIAAGDAAAIEGRVMGHYTYPYDEGQTAYELLEGDVHSKNAVAFYPDAIGHVDIHSPEFDKEDAFFKPFRDKSKNGFYCLIYGGGAPKLASTLGIPEAKGQASYNAFWDANPALTKLKNSVELFWETKGGKKWLPAVDGRRLMTRKKSALLNTIFQACGAIAMAYAVCYLDAWLGGIRFDSKFRPYYLYKGKVVKRIGYYHDELEFECEGEEVAKEVSKLIEKAIEKAGERLKLRVPLAGEGKVGKTWEEVH